MTCEQTGCQKAVVGLLVEVQGEILLVQRALSRTNGGYWSIPSGHAMAGESLPVAAARELLEETAICAQREQLTLVTSVTRHGDEGYYSYHLYRLCLQAKPKITLNFEHNTYKWATASEALNLELVPGGAELLHFAHTKGTN